MSYSFPCTHQDLIDVWQDTDYESRASQGGNCVTCPNQSVDIVTQEGAFRNGLNVGFCIDCIVKNIPNQSDL